MKFPSRDIKANDLLILTSRGMEAVTKQDTASIYEAEIMLALQEHSPNTLTKISKQSDESILKFSEAAKRLKKRGMIEIAD